LQTYAPRDPLAEFCQGVITFRQLRVMVQGLAMDQTTPIGRIVGGPWGDRERLLADVATTLRHIAAGYMNVHRPAGTPPVDVEPIPVPTPTVYQRKAAKRRAHDTRHERESEAGLLAVLARDREEAPGVG